MSTSPRMNVLNSLENVNHSVKVIEDASAYAVKLQKMMLRMKGQFMAADGKGVDYFGLGKSDLYKEYKEYVLDLRGLDLKLIKDDSMKKAFFINIYNALTIDGLVSESCIPDSVLNVKHFWRMTAYHIGGFDFNLDDIEHGLLRGNRGHPASKKPQFAEGDPRTEFIVEQVDPRIHFALVCGAKSCPAVNVYTPENVDRALESAAKSFCQQEVSCDVNKNFIQLSKLFLWYRDDFGKTDVDAVRWTLNYVSDDVAEDLRSLLKQIDDRRLVDIRYSDYDWSLNGVLKVTPQEPPTLGEVRA